MHYFKISKDISFKNLLFNEGDIIEWSPNDLGSFYLTTRSSGFKRVYVKNVIDNGVSALEFLIKNFSDIKLLNNNVRNKYEHKDN